MRCDRCGKFTRHLIPLPCNPAADGWAEEVCLRCHRAWESSRPVVTPTR